MLHLFAGLDLHTGLLLLLALAFVLFYEAINGFHDTANAVATVIYTRAMRSQLAVVMAAVFNFLGVLLGGLSVAYAIVHMLPTDLLLIRDRLWPCHGVLYVAGGDYLEPGYLVLWFTCIQLSYAHWRDHRDWFNQCVDDRDVSGGCTQYPESIKYFGPIVSPIVGLVFAGGLIFLLRRYWSGTKKRARIHLTPASVKRKTARKSRRSGRVSR